MPSNNPTSGSDSHFTRRVFIVAGVTMLVVVLWFLSEILLLVFGSVLVAVMLRALAVPLSRALRIGEGWGLVLAGTCLVAILVAAGVLFGTTLSEQMRSLSEQLAYASSRLGEQLQLGSLTELLKGNPAGSLGMIASRLFAWSSTLLGVLGGILLVVFGGIYLALNPELYRKGFLMLLPPDIQPNIEAVLEDSHEALRRWLGAQVIAMLLVGGMIGLGLSFIGVPSAIALGVIAGVAEFVPTVGPILRRSRLCWWPERKACKVCCGHSVSSSSCSSSRVISSRL